MTTYLTPRPVFEHIVYNSKAFPCSTRLVNIIISRISYSIQGLDNEDVVHKKALNKKALKIKRMRRYGIQALYAVIQWGNQREKDGNFGRLTDIQR